MQDSYFCDRDLKSELATLRCNTVLAACLLQCLAYYGSQVWPVQFGNKASVAQAFLAASRAVAALH